MKMKTILFALNLGFISCFGLNNSKVIINNQSNQKMIDTSTTIDVKKQVKVVKEIESNFSAPAVGEMLLNYYHNFINIDQSYIAYQMHTNVNHIGTNYDDFYHFLVSQIDSNDYSLRRVSMHFGHAIKAISYFVYQVFNDLQQNILPILILNGNLPGFGEVRNRYVIINGVNGNLDKPMEITFEYLDTLLGHTNFGTFSSQQISLLWKDGLGYYFGLVHK